MKNSFIIIGFVLFSFIAFGLMQFSKTLVKDYGEWSPSGDHMRHIEEASQNMLDKCKLDRIQGRLKGHKESVECANPAIHEAFAKEHFPHMDKVDEFLAQRVEYAKKLDHNEITDDEMRELVTEAQGFLLESAQPAGSK